MVHPVDQIVIDSNKEVGDVVDPNYIQKHVKERF